MAALSLFVGDECGLLKGVSVAGADTKRLAVVGDAVLAREQAILRVASVPHGGILSVNSQSVVQEWTGAVAGEAGAAAAGRRWQLGWKEKCVALRTAAAASGAGGSSPAGTGTGDATHAVAVSEAGAVSVIPLVSDAGSDDDDEAGVEQFTVAGPVAAADVSRDMAQFCWGGRENDLKIRDMASGSVTYKARNVPHDDLDMRVPVWVRGARFLPPQAAAGGSKPGTVVAVVTGHHHVRIYDVRAGRRPVKSVTEGEFPYTCMALSGDGSSIVAGDTTGALRRFDVSTLRVSGSYKGIGGALRDVDVHPTADVVASVGLDRCLRLHDLKTRRLLHRVYLKQRLNCVVFAADDGTGANGGAGGDGGEGDGTDDVWAELAALGGSGTSEPSKRGAAAAAPDSDAEEEEEEDDSGSDEDGSSDASSDSAAEAASRAAAQGKRRRAGRRAPAAKRSKRKH